MSRLIVDKHPVPTDYASAYVCGEKLKRALRESPTVNKEVNSITIGSRKFNLETLQEKIDILSREYTLKVFALYQKEGLLGIVKGLYGTRRALQSPKKSKELKKID